MRVVIPLVAFPVRFMHGHVSGNTVFVHKIFCKIFCQFSPLFLRQLSGQSKLELSTDSCIFSFLCRFGGIPKLFTVKIYARW
jgi:hypothetical protein